MPVKHFLVGCSFFPFGSVGIIVSGEALSITKSSFWFRALSVVMSWRSTSLTLYIWLIWFTSGHDSVSLIKFAYSIWLKLSVCILSTKCPVFLQISHGVFVTILWNQAVQSFGPQILESLIGNFFFNWFFGRSIFPQWFRLPDLLLDFGFPV